MKCQATTPKGRQAERDDRDDRAPLQVRSSPIMLPAPSRPRKAGAIPARRFDGDYLPTPLELVPPSCCPPPGFEGCFELADDESVRVEPVVRMSDFELSEPALALARADEVPDVPIAAELPEDEPCAYADAAKAREAAKAMVIALVETMCLLLRRVDAKHLRRRTPPRQSAEPQPLPDCSSLSADALRL
jgi:hypothetical protein